MSVARDDFRRSFDTVACIVENTVLLEHIPLTVAPVPHAPLSEIQMILDLTAAPDADQVSVLMQLLMRYRVLITWILAERTTQEGLGCQGYLTRVVFPTTAAGRTTMTLEMHLPASCATCQTGMPLEA